MNWKANWNAVQHKYRRRQRPPRTSARPLSGSSERPRKNASSFATSPSFVMERIFIFKLHHCLWLPDIYGRRVAISIPMHFLTTIGEGRRLVLFQKKL